MGGAGMGGVATHDAAMGGVRALEDTATGGAA